MDQKRRAQRFADQPDRPDRVLAILYYMVIAGVIIVALAVGAFLLWR